MTTYGAPWWFIRLVLPDPSRAVIMGGLGRLCGRGIRRWLALYNIDGASEAQRAAFLARVEREFARF